MAGGKLRSRIRWVYKRSSRATKIAVCAAIIVSVVALLVIRSETLAAQQQYQKDLEQAQKLEQEKDQLKDKIENLGSQAGLVQYVKDVLGWLENGDIVIEKE